jgi:hypothetical protein
MLGHWRLGAYLDLRPSVVAWRGGLVVVLVALVFVGGGRRRGREVGVRRRGRGRVGGGCHGEVLGGAGGGGEGASAAADGADASWDWEAVGLGLGLDAASWDRGWPRFGSARGGWRGDAREKA